MAKIVIYIYIFFKFYFLITFYIHYFVISFGYTAPWLGNHILYKKIDCLETFLAIDFRVSALTF